MGEDHDWRNQRKIQVIAAIDVLIGVFFIIFYIYYGITFMAGVNPVPAQELSLHFGRFLVFVLGVVVFSINGWQIYVAVTLFKLLKLEELNAQLCVKKSRLWFKTSVVLLSCIIVKFFFLCLVPLGSSNTFDFFLCLLEFIFRIFGLFFVKEFLDDVLSDSSITKSRKTHPSITTATTDIEMSDMSANPYSPTTTTITIISPEDIDLKIAKTKAYANAIVTNDTHHVQVEIQQEK